jgi:hypothetical protein
MKKYNFATYHFGEIHFPKKSKTNLSRLKENIQFYKIPFIAIVERITFVSLVILIGQLITSLITQQ